MTRLPFVITIPHCSPRIPDDVRSALTLDEVEIRASVDAGTAEIFAHTPAEAVLSAAWCRLVVDLNRDHRHQGPNGVVPLLDYDGRTVYPPGREPDEAERLRRLERYYFPFHDRLIRCLARPNVKGLVDCHSMNPVGPERAPDAGMRRKDIVLSNNGNSVGEADASPGGITCPGRIMRDMKALLENEGFSVALNAPYTGGFISRHYGSRLVPTGGLAVQIEVNQGLYVDEGGKASHAKTAGVRDLLLNVLEKIARELV
jgi:N-formylglutamate amidohydrolase